MVRDRTLRYLAAAPSVPVSLRRAVCSRLVLGREWPISVVVLDRHTAAVAVRPGKHACCSFAQATDEQRLLGLPGPDTEPAIACVPETEPAA